MRYYLGLDNGGTSTKAALFSVDGREVAVCAMDTAMLAERPGFVERDMDEMWRANCSVIRSVLQRGGVSPDEVAGVGICGHGKGLYLWGKDGRPARRGIISTDNRAYAYVKRWREAGVEEAAFKKTYQRILPCQPVALLAWLQDHEPQTIQNTRWIFECKDYVRFRMTGQAMAELTDISGTSLLNLRTREYDDELLGLLGLQSIRHALPPLCRSTDICGYVGPEAAEDCGLRAGTPVIGGMFDIDACALAVGITNNRNICMIAGTWSINEYLRKEPVLDGTVQMNSLFCMPEYYLIEESSPTSAGNNAWFIRQMFPERDKAVYELMNGWVEDVPIDEFVPIFLPFLMASNVHPNARGAFIGLAASHTRKHLCRSVYEGIAFAHRCHFERLMRSWPGEMPECIRLAGGAARSAVWAGMFADVMGLPVETVASNETGALGCAIATAVAVGDQPSLADAAAKMCCVSARFQPDEARREVYNKKYALYCDAIDALDELWPKMQEFIES